MKKHIYKTKALLAVFLLMITYSCGDDYLEEIEVFTIDSENYFNSESDYYDALVGAYDILQSTYLNALLGEIASDNTLCGGESATDVIGFQQIDDMIHTPVNNNLRDLWNWMYAGVSRTNFILEFQDKTDFEGREALIAETRFLRAYYYFELVKWFGPVPLKETRFQIGDETSIPRAPVSEVYALIEQDLNYAVNNLTYAAPQAGRATKGSAEALLGKAYLFQEKYREAATVLDNLIANGPYDLVEDYEMLWEAEGENSIESVFEVQYTDVEGASFDCLQCVEGNVAIGFSGIRNYTGPLFSSGFSFNVPTAESYNAYNNDDLRRDIAILDIDAWAAQEGATFATGFEHTGYFNRKYIPRKRSSEAAGDLNLTNPGNYRAIRFADVLLMAAEANNSGGISDTKAQEYLNRVRRRAFGVDDTSVDITNTGSNLTSDIVRERRLELMGEGHRFFDLVRTGEGSRIPGFQEGKHNVFPIPIEEIQFANGNWEQNPNY